MAINFRLLAVFATLLALTLPAGARASSFDKAKEALNAKIDKSQGHLNYNSLCSEKPGGGDKIGCHLRQFADLGFLVCKVPTYGDSTCQQMLNTEIANLTNVRRAGLQTVNFDTEVLGPLQCANDASNECYGYLVEWVEGAKFANLDDAVNQPAGIAVLANDLVQYVTPRNLVTTSRAVDAVRSFMAPTKGKYSRICDLQGFFPKSGGFIISDVPTLVVADGGTASNSPRECNRSSNPSQSGGDIPTWTAVYNGLDELSKALKAK